MVFINEIIYQNDAKILGNYFHATIIYSLFL